MLLCSLSIFFDGLLDLFMLNDVIGHTICCITEKYESDEDAGVERGAVVDVYGYRHVLRWL